MNIKYNIRKAILGGAVVLLATGCELDEKVYDFYNPDTYFTNTARLEMGVNAVYNGLTSQNTYGQNWLVYDTDTDLSHVKSPGTGHVARDLGHYNAYSSHPWLEDSWTQYYKCIDRANLILERQHTVPLKPTSADTLFHKNLVAQTKALRAIYYFDLVRLFGDVPHITKSVEVGDEYMIPKTDRNIIYQAIITDLEEAIPDLMWLDKTLQNGERISKGAAMGMLARIYLFKGGYSLYGEGSVGEMKRQDNYKEDYRQAKKILDELIGENKHGLLSSYERVFRNMCELVYDPYENMFEVAFFSLTGLKGTSSLQGTYNGPEININSKWGRANSFIKTYHFFYDWFEADGSDSRRNVSVATYQIDKDDNYKEIARNQSYNWSPGKWRRDWHTGKFKDNNNTDVNVVLLRYSDVLLMRAEVENELNEGPNELAIEAVNQVRRRAFGKPYLAPDSSIDFSVADFMGKDDFFKFLFKERARELAFEGHRRMDLIRWNLLDEAIKNTATAFTDAIASGELRDYSFDAGKRFKHNVHELYPIPDYDIRETNGVLKQNPGYN